MNEKRMTLATDWAGQDPTGWLMSEKHDGCRAYWDGRRLWTRGGRVIAAPTWFTRGLPRNHALDGELWAGYGGLEAARLATQYGRFRRGMMFAVFDCPTAAGTWAQRMGFAVGLVGKAPYAFCVSVRVCESRAHLALEDFDPVMLPAHILKQDVPAKKKVKEGRGIKVIVSKGPRVQSIPLIVNETLSNAESILLQKGLKISKVIRIHSDKIEKDRVIAQRPEPTEKVSDYITILVSLGTHEVIYYCPDFNGMTV